MTDAKAPHKAVLLVKMEVHEVKNTGECSGKILTKQELEKYGLSPKSVLTVNGFDRHDCIKKLKALIDEFESK